MYVLLPSTAVIFALITINLRSTWIPAVWLAGLGIWAGYFWRRNTGEPAPVTTSTAFHWRGMVVVLIAAVAVRLYRIETLPLGPYMDELLALTRSLELGDKSFDFFGHTPLVKTGWVETPNLYLYFNLLILKIFGVHYWSLKLFSIIPGVVSCVVVHLICQLCLEHRVALGAGLIFAVSHWHVRLSRYGWDVSFMIMAFSLAIWLLLTAIQRQRLLFAYLSGVTAGISLYSYIASRACLFSLAVFLGWEWTVRRERWLVKVAGAFAAGATVTAFPLLVYYLSNPTSFWVRFAELSIFNASSSLSLIFGNLWRHLLMFHVHGGTYARDNFPGIAMMDPVTGLLFIAGLLALVRNCEPWLARFLGWIFLLNLLPGVLSVSQEGAPYVYRTAAVIVPAFLIVGLGCQWVNRKMTLRLPDGLTRQTIGQAAWILLLLIGSINFYLYFFLEPKNAGAMRTMAYEARAIGLEIAKDNLPVYLIGQDVLDKIEIIARPEEKYARFNAPMVLPPLLSGLAIISFSGRYDLAQPLAYNLSRPSNIHFVASPSAAMKLSLPNSAKLIFNSRNQEIIQSARRQIPAAAVEEIQNIYGEPMLTVFTYLVQ
jgi:4-amino-4-deoxy-L-arabinose transferase-like glycosyltransferase